MAKVRQNEFDAVVIGGGPAGAVSAIWLARLGWRTALIERGGRHRTKTCGHCLNPRAFACLQRIGLCAKVHAIAAGRTNKLRVHMTEGHAVEIGFGDHRDAAAREGVIVERRALDQLLLDHAAATGVQVFQETSARAVLTACPLSIVRMECGKGWQELSARLVVGADGVGSGVARSANLASVHSAGRKYGFSFDLNGRAAADINPLAIAMFITAGGYLGAVNRGDGVLHIAALVSSALDAQSRGPMGFVRHISKMHGQLDRLGLGRAQPSAVGSMCAVGPIPWRPQAIANERVALVGDAARYVEPFTGEGMTWAIESAEVLAEILHDVAPGRWGRSTARHYSRLWNDRIGRRQNVCRALAYAFDRPRFARLMFRASDYLPGIRQRVVAKVMAA